MEIIFLLIGSIYFFLLPFISEFLCHFVIFSLLFNVGLFSLVGVPPFYVKLVADILIIALLIKNIGSIVVRNNKIRNTGIVLFIAFILVSVYSFLINDVNLITYMYFLRITVIPVMYLFAILNSTLDENSFSKLFHFLIFLFAVQIPAIIAKFMIIGQSEKGAIGTISTEEGSLSTIIPLFAISFLFSSFLSTKRKTLIVWMFLFVLFGIIGEKRAIVLYVPVVVSFILLLDIVLDLKKSRTILPKIKYTFFSIIIITVLVYITAVTNPTLNPAGRVGGSFDLEYLINYTKEYETRTRDGNAQYLGRLVAPSRVFSTVASHGFENILFGLGPGVIVESRFVEGSQDVLLDKYGIGYGARTGILWLFFQIGLIGCFFYLLFFLYLSIVVYKKYILLDDNKCIYLLFFSLTFVYFVDLFTYSFSMMHSGALMLSYFFAFSYICKNVKIPVPLGYKLF